MTKLITAWKADFTARQVFAEQFHRETQRAYMRPNYSLATRDTQPYLTTQKVTKYWSYHATEREAWDALASWLAVQLVKNEDYCRRINNEYLAAYGRLQRMAK